MSGPDYHGWTHRPKAQGGTDPIGVTLGLSFASVKKAAQSFTAPSASPFTELSDLSSAAFKTNDPTRLSLIEDTTGTPYWGVSIPTGLVVQVTTTVQFADIDFTDGTHITDISIGGAYTGAQFFPPSSEALPTMAAITDPMEDAYYSGRQSIIRLAHIGYNGGAFDTWTLGMVHACDNYTLGPQDFIYEMSVTIIGDYPT